MSSEEKYLQSLDHSAQKEKFLQSFDTKSEKEKYLQGLNLKDSTNQERIQDKTPPLDKILFTWKQLDDLQWTAMYDREKVIKKKHSSQTTTYVQFERTDETGAANVLNDREYEIKDMNFLQMMAKVRMFLLSLTENKPKNSQHIVACGTEKHPAFAAALVAGCADFDVSLTLVYKDENGKLYEQFLF